MTVGVGLGVGDGGGSVDEGSWVGEGDSIIVGVDDSISSWGGRYSVARVVLLPFVLVALPLHRILALIPAMVGLLRSSPSPDLLVMVNRHPSGMSEQAKQPIRYLISWMP